MRNLEAKRQILNAHIEGRRRAAAPLPCGHPAACQTRVTSSLHESTVECQWCADIQTIVDALAAVQFPEANEFVRFALYAPESWLRLVAQRRELQSSVSAQAPGAARNPIAIREYSSSAKQEAA